jgi:uncharacterized protein YcnI
MKKLLLIPFLALATQTLAHVTIRNEANSIESISNKSDTFRMVVPVSSGAITQVRLVIPSNVTFLYLEPVSGWSYELIKNPEGKVTEVVYKGSATAGEVIRFPFIAKNPEKSDTLVEYKAYVTQKDGTIVPFDGSEAAKGYAPRILLK